MARHLPFAHAISTSGLHFTIVRVINRTRNDDGGISGGVQNQTEQNPVVRLTQKR